MPTTKKSRQRWYLPALAAAGVAVVATGIAIASPDAAQNSPDAARDRTGQVLSRPAAGRPLVRDGARVEVSGTVIAAPGRPVVYCPDLPTPAIGYPPGKEPPPSCPDRLAVRLTGVDLGRLAHPGSRNGVRFGRATLRGTWHDRSMAVDEQTPQAAVPTTPPQVGQVPCAAPPGGWRSGRWGDAPVQAGNVIAHVRSQPGRFDDVRVGYPSGLPTSRTEPPTILTEVIVVPLLTGDLEQARRELGRLYSGNLCVYRATRLFGLNDLAAANAAMDALLRDLTNAIHGFAPGSPTKPGEVELLVLDERVYAAIDRIGFKYFDLKPSVRPV